MIRARIEESKRVGDGKSLASGGTVIIVDYTLDTEVGAPKRMRLPINQVVSELEAAKFHTATPAESLPQ